ncbi:MAG: hypothetical protein WAW37_10400 [Syntrophobacteraceae bacterium]
MRRTLVCVMLVAFLQAVLPPAGEPAGPCGNALTPPFIANATKPNILIILDNSNSMDEDFYGNAVGSYSPASKSVVAKKAIRDLITQLQPKINAGLMTYNLPSGSGASGVVSNYLYNSAYFGTYNSAAYCADPPQECVDYCITEDAAKKSACEAACPGLDAAYRDAIITNAAANSQTRQTYCPLIYPKTQRKINPTDPSRYIYYKGAYPTYTGSDLGDYYFRYAGTDCSGTYYVPWNNPPYTYKQYTSKTGTADNFAGYTGYFSTGTYGPSDSDKALGYYNFGPRRYSYYIGDTWFSNAAAPTSQMGYLKAPVGALDNTTHFDKVYDVLAPKENDSAGYMSCTASDKDTCSYIVNAGLTPTAGTLKTAYNYFNGAYSTTKYCYDSAGWTNGQTCSSTSGCTSPFNASCTVTKSPIKSKCQKNYIIYVTDGLPSTNLAGQSTIDVASLMPEVITQLNNLKTGVTRNVDGANRTFPIKTYVLGVGLTAQAKTKLDQMAVAGGTATASGHAYYADNPTQLTDALQTIVTDLLARVASGSSISILSEGQTHMGANMLQGVFYPTKYFGSTVINWPGYLYDYWFYNTKTLNNIREDTVHDYILALAQDNGLTFLFDDQNGLSVSRKSDPTGSGDPSQPVDTVDLDALNPIWEAGKQLFKTLAGDRRIFISDSNLIVGTKKTGDFADANAALTTPGSSPLGLTANIDPCLAGANDTATLRNLINYVRGDDSFATCRKRTVGLCSNGTDLNGQPCAVNGDCTISGFSVCQQGVWKLGDIVYSTPKVQTDYKYCSNGSVFNDVSCLSDADCTSAPYSSCQKKENVIFVGANDGMLHAFKSGIESNVGLNAGNHEVEKLIGIPTSDMGKELWAFIPRNSLPYLRCLAIPPPGSCHLYYSDLSPYLTRMNVGGASRIILIGGMRLGGAALDATGNKYCFDGSSPTPISNGQTCGDVSTCLTPPYTASCTSSLHFNAPADTCGPVQCSDPNTCYNPPGCTGLSSYYALDITDVESPRLLWEFSHPMLGYSYSGPAVIHKWADPATKTGDRYYVMFASGPTDAINGSSIQNVKSFVLSLDANLGIGSVYVKDFGENAKKGFGGRLFTNGLDVNVDGFTDFVFFGYGYSSSGNPGDWKGGIAKINTNYFDSGDTAVNNRTFALDATRWDYDISNYSNIAQLPITAKIETMQCFNQWYLYGGTGRYFFPMDDYGPSGVSGKNFIMGTPFMCNENNQGCTNINSLNKNTSACTNLTKAQTDSSFWDKAGWQYMLNDAEGVYLRERMTTDPVTSNTNKVFFTTAEPTGDACGYGGRSRVWGLNCATGAALSDTTCAGFGVSDMTGTLYLQTSTGAINKIDPTSSFTDGSTGHRTTDWMVGMPPENAPPLVLPAAPARSGQIIHWIEK